MVKCYKKGYFRPQFVRDEWTDLNGEWEFAFDDDDIGEREKYFDALPASRKIVVPFSYETAASGIHDEEVHPVVWYKRTFRAQVGKDERFLLHFEGMDYLGKVWLNGIFLGAHEGGYCRYTLDATNALKAGDNVLTVRCEDSLDARQPRGKQRWLKNSYGCWYVQTTGIWKPVWGEKFRRRGWSACASRPIWTDSASMSAWILRRKRSGARSRLISPLQIPPLPACVQWLYA